MAHNDCHHLIETRSMRHCHHLLHRCRLPIHPLWVVADPIHHSAPKAPFDQPRLHVVLVTVVAVAAMQQRLYKSTIPFEHSPMETKAFGEIPFVSDRCRAMPWEHCNRPRRQWVAAIILVYFLRYHAVVVMVARDRHCRDEARTILATPMPPTAPIDRHHHLLHRRRHR
jgi:hypothetical protein